MPHDHPPEDENKPCTGQTACSSGCGDSGCSTEKAEPVDEPEQETSCSTCGGSHGNDGETESPNGQGGDAEHVHEDTKHTHSGCGHNHAPGETCSGNHGDDVDPGEFNNGWLNRIFSDPKSEGTALNNARASIALLGAVGLSQLNLSDTGSIAAMTAASAGALVIANEATQELMESVQRSKAKLGLSGGAIGTLLAGAHIATESIIAVKAQLSQAFTQSASAIGTQLSETFNQTTDFALQLSYANNLLHANFMPAIIAGAAGTLLIAAPHIRKMNLAAMSVGTGALAAHVAIGEAGYPYGSGYILGGIGAATAIGYGIWRFRAGIGCADHGDLCGHARKGPVDETDYIGELVKVVKSPGEPARKLVNKMASVTPSGALESLNQRTEKIGNAITNFKMPTREQIKTTMTGMVGPSIAFTGVSVAAHTLTDNAVSIAEINAAPAAAVGFIAGVGLVSGELFAGALSAAKAKAIELKAKAEGIKLRDLTESDNYRQLADAMIVGCTIMGTAAATGIHAGLGNALGNAIPDSFKLDVASYGWNGVVQMGMLTAPIPIYWAATRKKWVKPLAHFENRMADKIETKAEKLAPQLKWMISEEKFMNGIARFSNSLRDGIEQRKLSKLAMPKTVAAGMLATSLAALTINTLPVCHRHGEFQHCFDPNAQIEIDPSLPSLESLAREPSPAPAP
ncbi:MAG: hypothetical protein AB8B83_06255 [Bdellovibrionales bacterium]